MTTTVPLPQFGDVPGGTVLRWLVPIGGLVEQDEALLELDTELFVLEVPSPTSGVLTAQLVQPSQPVACGDPIAIIDGARS